MVSHCFFYVTLLITGSYLILYKRKHDFLTLAFFSTLVYATPLIFGLARYPRPRKVEIVPIGEEVYFVYGMLFVGILVALIIKDAATKHYHIKYPKNTSLAFVRRFSYINTLLACSGFLITLSVLGPILFESKVDIYEHMTRYYYLWTVPAFIGAVVSFSQRLRVPFLICITLLMADLVLVSNRTYFAFALTGVLLNYLRALGPIRLIKLWRFGIIGILMIWSLSFFHHFKNDIKKIDLDSAILTYERVGLFRHLSISEPFTTISILDAVLKSNYRTDGKHFASAIYTLLPAAPAWGVPITRFSDYHQPDLFPGLARTGVMGSNFLAEYYAVGGLLFLVAGIGLYCLLILILSLVVDCHKIGRLETMVLVVGIPFALYAHRNDLISLLSIVRRVSFFVLIGTLLASPNIRFNLSKFCFSRSTRGFECLNAEKR